ncbi:MAG: hypothetical protein K0R19_1977 [Bacillota bacterium]|jgi:hypothetical protein|nr:hypothetical protein [Bacillota bacterium]
MKLKNSWFRAIDLRTSRRTYKNQIMDGSKIEQIKALIAVLNEESGLRIQFTADGRRLLSGFRASYGMISGRPSMIAMAGNPADPEFKRKVGFYGELLVLECVSLGLGTCWLGGTFDREECRKAIALDETEELACVIAVGLVPEKKTVRETVISQVGKSKPSFDELLAEKDSTPPLWVARGIEAARFAPSAANKKPSAYRFLQDQLFVYASKKNHDAEEIDLGISMAHFQLGAMQGLKEGAWVKKDNGYLFV